MKLFSFIAFLIFSFCACSEDDSKLLNEINATEYFWGINKCEEFILNKEYGLASDEYKKIILGFNARRFGYDLHNALLCSIKAKEYENASLFAKELMMMGCELEYFNQLCFQDFLSTKEWNRIKDNYKKLRQKYEEKVNKEYRAKLETLDKRDQYLRQQDPSYEFLRDSILTEDLKIISELKELILDFGFPTENTIGITIVNDTIIVPSPVHIIIRHQYQNGDYSLTPYLRQMVEEGVLSNREFASWHSIELGNQGRIAYGRTPFTIINNELYLRKEPVGFIEQINLNRQDIYLSSFDVFSKKIKYNMNSSLTNKFYLSQYAAVTETWEGFDISSTPKEIFDALFIKVED